MEKPLKTEPSLTRTPTESSMESARKIEGYIKEGLEFIRKGQYEEAERHFGNVIKAKNITGIRIGWGELQTIQSLLSHKELKNALYVAFQI